MDIRSEKTENSIINAFIELRSKKALNKVTIKELCEKAKINKSTFYTHYKDIYDLSDKLEDIIIKDIIADIPNLENIVENPAEFTQNLFRSTYSKASVLNIVFSKDREPYLIEKIAIALKKIIFNRFPKYKNDTKFLVSLDFNIYGGYYSYQKNVLSNLENEETVLSVLKSYSTFIKLYDK